MTFNEPIRGRILRLFAGALLLAACGAQPPPAAPEPARTTPVSATPRCSFKGIRKGTYTYEMNAIDWMITRCDGGDECALSCLAAACGNVFHCQRECRLLSSRTEPTVGQSSLEAVTAAFQRKAPEVMENCWTNTWRRGDPPAGPAADYQEPPDHAERSCNALSRDAELVTQIAIERTPCLGRCPVYWARLDATGDVEMFGSAHVAHLGLHHGRLTTRAASPPSPRRPVRNDLPKTKGVAQGFDLHADITVAAADRDGRERLCRYILRPPLVLERLSLTEDGRIAYERKYKSEGASHVVMTPTDLLAGLAALVFPPRHPMLRYHGCFAANHKLRAKVVPASPPAQRAAPALKLEKVRRGRIEDSVAAAPPASTRASANLSPDTSAPSSLRGGLAAINHPIDWASLLKRVYQIDVLRCPCGGALRMVALVIERKPVRDILVAMGLDPSPPARAPPRQGDFG